MKRVRLVSLLILLLVCTVALMTSCGSGGPGSHGGRKTRTSVLSPDAAGSTVLTGDTVTMDASNVSEGYIMIKYSGSASKIKIQITGPDGNIYTYTSKTGKYQTFPLTAGNGTYSIDVLENVVDTMYSLVTSQSVEVNIEDEFKPFLYPNQYVWFTKKSECVGLAQELSGKSEDDLSFVQNVYEYVTKKISYDDAKAQNVPVDYIPDLDDTLDSGKGICFDYASLMAAMLRSQSIPTKLVVGYSGTAYHAWISVYLDETGWVDNMIEFDGQDWSLMDPTLASTGGGSAVKEYVGDGSHYQAQYHY